MNQELQRGDRILLPQSKKISVRLSWDNTKPTECDLMAFLMDENNSIPSRWDIIFYNVPQHISHSICQRGTICEDDHCTDRIDIKLGKVPETFRSIMLLSCIYDAGKRGQSLMTVENLRFSLVDNESGEELCFYDVKSNNQYARSIIFGSIRHEEDGWSFVFDPVEDSEELIGVIATRYGMRVDWRSDYKNFDPNKGIFA